MVAVPPHLGRRRLARSDGAVAPSTTAPLLLRCRYGVTVSVPCCVEPPSVPDTVTVVVAATDRVVAVKLTAKFPAGTVTVAGTVTTAGLSALSATVVLLVTALVSVTLPCDETPPTTLDGVKNSELTAIGGGPPVTVSTAVLVTPPKAAPIVAGVFAVTAL